MHFFNIYKMSWDWSYRMNKNWPQKNDFLSHTNRLFEKSQLSKQIQINLFSYEETCWMEWRKPCVKMRTCARVRQIQWPPAKSDCLTEVSSDSPMNNSKISKVRRTIGNDWKSHFRKGFKLIWFFSIQFFRWGHLVAFRLE